jgi:alkylated DNA repair dioxygenase AlkB
VEKETERLDGPVVRELPEGFDLKPDFISREDEMTLLAAIQSLEFRQFQMHGVTAKRRVVQFGWRYSFGTYGLTPTLPLPEAFEPVRAQAAGFAGVSSDDFAEALVTEYQPGAGIGWHRDAPPFDIVAGISLAGSCRMRFQRGTGTEREVCAVELPPRSIYLLTGSARKNWQHTIPPTKELRYSITFRTLRHKPRAAATPA